MKNVKRKTEQERSGEELLMPTKVNETSYYYWVCDRCSVAYFDNDIILRASGGGYKCPLPRGFFKRQCSSSIFGGDEQSFNKYYKVIPSSL